MALYTCEDLETGRETVLEIPMDDAPSIGSEFEMHDRRYRRLVERQTQALAKYHDVFWCFQVNRKSAAAADCDFRDARGTPGFSSRRRAQAWADKWSDGRGLDAAFDG